MRKWKNTAVKASLLALLVLPFGMHVMAEGDGSESETPTPASYEQLATQYAAQNPAGNSGVADGMGYFPDGTTVTPSTAYSTTATAAPTATPEATETTSNSSTGTAITSGSSKEEGITNAISEDMAVPESAVGEKFPGSGTLIDYTTSGSKHFFTIKTTDERIFYLIIDSEKATDNTYFLEEINSDRLSNNTPVYVAPTATADPNAASASKSSGGNILVPILGLGGLAALYIYMTKIRPKQKENAKKTNSNPSNDDVPEEDELDDELLEDLEEEA